MVERSWVEPSSTLLCVKRTLEFFVSGRRDDVDRDIEQTLELAGSC